ncbi:LysM peptidoglycan-binding domain-containing protein, partial [Cellulomonas cellasea]
AGAAPRPAVGTLRRPVPASHGATVVRAEERPLRLTRRGRLVVLLLAALVLVAGVQGGQALADGPSRALEVTTYTVGVGETLWEIAAESARPGEDVRDVVLELQSLNGLATAGLDAGQEIILPVQR